MKKTFLLLLLLVASVSVYAQSDDLVTTKGYVRGNYSQYHYFKSYEGVLYEVRDGYATENSTTLTPLPEVLVKFPQNKNVTSYTVLDKTQIIAKGAFQGNQYIQTIRIPSTVSHIGDDAFADCENLRIIEVYSSSSSSVPVIEDNRDTEKEEIGRYNINGVQVEETEDGIQIILYSDGSANKVLKKP